MKKKRRVLVTLTGIMMAVMMAVNLFSLPLYAAEEVMAGEGVIQEETLPVSATVSLDEKESISLNVISENTVSKNGYAEGDRNDIVSETDESGESTASENAAGGQDMETGTEGEGKESVSKNIISENGLTLSINCAGIMYGEDGSNEKGNLDSLFDLRLFREDEEIEDFEAEYKFFKDTELSGNIDLDSFETTEGIKLEDQNAGEEITAVVKVTCNEGNILGLQKITIEKRRVNIKIKPLKDITVEEKTAPENGLFVVSENLAKKLDLTVECAGYEDEGRISVFASDELTDLELSDITDQDVVYDLSGVDYDSEGYISVPADIVLSEGFSKNFVLESRILGGAYVKKSQYFVTFTVYNNGEKKEETIISDITVNTTLAQFLKNKNKYDYITGNMGGFVDTSKNDTITAWNIVPNHNDSNGGYIDSNFQYKNGSSTEDYTLVPKTDYNLTAYIKKSLGDDIYCDAVPNVKYDGRAHLSCYQELKAADYKSKINDIRLRIYSMSDGSEVDLRYGTDYTVKYKNNTAASMTTDGVDQYTAIPDLAEAKKPCMIISGKGEYKGFSAKVYFDILPQDLGLYNFSNNKAYMYTDLCSLAGSYTLNTNGKLKTKPDPAITVSRYYKYSDSNYHYKQIRLKNGVDYSIMIFKYNESSKIWEYLTDNASDDCFTEGRYLYRIKGTGNYCGQTLGAYENYIDKFSTGEDESIYPAVCEYNSSEIPDAQFIVRSDVSKDLSKAKVVIGTASKAYKENTKYGSNDFKISVYAGNTKLTEGTDYRIKFDGDDYRYIYKRTSSGSGYIYNTAYTSAVYYDEIFMANKYKVVIEAIGGNANGYFGSNTAKKKVAIKGIKVKKNWFKLKTKSMKYDGSESGAGSYTYSYKAKVRPYDPYIIGFDSSGNSEYLDNVYSSIQSNAVCVLSDYYDRMTGTYSHTILPLGAGVDHSSLTTATFKRVGISTKQALKGGYLKVAADTTAEYNAGGALPKNVQIYFNGKWTTVGNMLYPTASYTVKDSAGYEVTLTLSVANNKSPAKDAKIILKGDNKTFKGSAAAATFYVNPAEIKDKTVKVLSRDDYKKITGLNSSYVDGSIAGDLYAVASPVKKTDGTLKPKITLYQAYFKNQSDYTDGNLSLAKVAASQYKLEPSVFSGCAYNVAVSNKGKAYSFSNVKLGDYYTVYDEAAKIASVTVKYKGEEFTFPGDETKEITYTGSQIRFDSISSITLSNGEVLGSDDAYIEYGNNIKAGKKNGSFTVILKRNAVKDSFKYYGTKKFKFTIVDNTEKTI